MITVVQDRTRRRVTSRGPWRPTVLHSGLAAALARSSRGNDRTSQSNRYFWGPGDPRMFYFYFVLYYFIIVIVERSNV
jgi:hypothetical protein